MCPIVTDHPADHCHIVLELKILMLSASVSFILHRSLLLYSPEPKHSAYSA